jgi:hypothetical protein
MDDKRCADCGRLLNGLDSWPDGRCTPCHDFYARPHAWTLTLSAEAPNGHRHDCDCDDCREVLDLSDPYGKVTS